MLRKLILILMFMVPLTIWTVEIIADSATISSDSAFSEVDPNYIDPNDPDLYPE